MAGVFALIKVVQPSLNRIPYPNGFAQVHVFVKLVKFLALIFVHEGGDQLLNALYNIVIGIV